MACCSRSDGRCADDVKTSDVYRTSAGLPYRFEHPSRWNYGNCVFTPSEGVMDRFGKAAADGHPFYRTTNAQYGSRPPCVHTMPQTFHPRSHRYWEHLASVGMYRDCGFNTGMDKSAV